MHTGYCRPTASPPPPAIQELRATVKVLPPQDCKSPYESELSIFKRPNASSICLYSPTDFLQVSFMMIRLGIPGFICHSLVLLI